MDTCVINLTESAFKYGNLNLRACGNDFFPPDAFGGPNKKAGLGVQVTLEAQGLPNPISTDIPTDRVTGRPRWMFRERKWLKEFVRCHNLAVGNKVVLYRLNKGAYTLSAHTRPMPIDLFEDTLTPIVYAQKLAERYIHSTTAEYRKQRGQFFTPPEVAAFMAKLAVKGKNPPVRILDPGGGAGTLSCAVCEELSRRQVIKRVEIDTYENDAGLVRVLHESLGHASRWLEKRGIQLDFKIVSEDFVLSARRARRDACWRSYDLVIANPPYSKISAKDPRARAVSEVVYGQPNLYTLFMAASVKLLGDSGFMVFITPRSYATGHYFTAFREVFFAQVKPVRIHVFESRKDVFPGQSVLQESVILKVQKGTAKANVSISRSKDSSDLNACPQRKVPLGDVLFRTKKDVVLRLPLDALDDLIIEIVHSWQQTLLNYDLHISTGPVVPFRAKDFIPDDGSSTTERLVPLLWMQNVQPMRIIWPRNGLGSRDANHQFIVGNSETRRHRLVLRNRNMVLLRRFSAKEQKRRLTAAPLFGEQLDFEFVGVENHLNYIHRRTSEMSCEEAEGFAAIFNSQLLDRYFRICSGNTQVSATELRVMPLPPLDLIRKLGRDLLAQCPTPTLSKIDAYVWGMVKPYTKRKSLLDRLLK